MADTVALVARVRRNLVEGTASYWTDAEIVDHINKGIGDLWRAICDNFQDYFFAINESVTQASATATLSSVPTNVAKVNGIEPLVGQSYPNLKYTPKTYNHPAFAAARAADNIDPTQGGEVYYALTGAGAPVGAPTIYVAPKFNATVALRLIYTPTTPKLTTAAGQENPVPGESDLALEAWATAHALAREREDRKPDPDWIAIYGTEKTNILTFLTPRQNDEPDVAEAVHAPWIDG
jgi:hypothetical protein